LLVKEDVLLKVKDELLMVRAPFDAILEEPLNTAVTLLKLFVLLRVIGTVVVMLVLLIEVDWKEESPVIISIPPVMVQLSHVLALFSVSVIPEEILMIQLPQ